MSITVHNVQQFWNSHPCQSDLSGASERKQYFAEISSKRYGGREWHVPLVARFPDFKGRDVLEIGCGIATDGLEFARHGARYVGVDLTSQAIEMARERFALFSVPGSFYLANAEERLPFDDCSFDHIYSFGVIHHSPNTEAIVRRCTGCCDRVGRSASWSTTDPLSTTRWRSCSCVGLDATCFIPRSCLV